MADQQVDVKILTVDAVTNLNELKKAIHDTKEELSKQELGSEKYRELLGELIKEQNLMRGAMNGTTADMETLKKATDGTTVSYNGMVNSMANAKRELRNLDLSTKAGRDRYAELSKEIKNTNDALKKLDEDQGSYVRNVGNYTSGLKNLGDVLKQSIPTLGNVAQGIDGVDKSVKLLGQQPLFGIIGLLAPLLAKIAEEIKADDSAMASVKKGMEALKPITDFFAGILDKIIDLVTDLISRLSEFFSGSDIFKKLVQGVMGVGNAILQYVIAPFKGVIAAIKVFQDEGIKGFRNAAKAFGNEFKSGFAFKENFKAGQAVADAIVSGAKSRKKNATDAGKDLAKETADAWEKEMQKRVKEFADRVKAKTEAEKYLKGLRDATEKDMESLTASIDAETQAELAATIAMMEDQAEAERIIQEQAVKDAEEAAQKKIAAMSAFASGTANLLDTIADAYESNGEMTEQEEKRVKNLRIAAATINMLQGAVTAFSSAQSLGPIAGPIVGAINAAAVVATGMANIAKIRSTNVSRDSAPSTTATAPAQVSAPTVETAVPTTTVVNGANTERALNAAARPQKVYVVESEIQAVGEQADVTNAESSF